MNRQGKSVSQRNIKERVITKILLNIHIASAPSIRFQGDFDFLNFYIAQPLSTMFMKQNSKTLFNIQLGRFFHLVDVLPTSSTIVQVFY